jgi:hypothetical protein
MHLERGPAMIGRDAHDRHHLGAHLMSATDSRLIIFLLCAILAVLLLGREAVLGSAQIILWIMAGGMVLLIVRFVAKSIFFDTPKELISEVRGLRRSGKPWLVEAILVIGMPFGIVWVVGLTATKYLGYTAHEPYTAMAGVVWFVFFPLFLLAGFLRWVRSIFQRKPALEPNIKGNVRRDFGTENSLGFSLEHQDDSMIQVRHEETGTTFAIRLVNGRPTGPYHVAPGLSSELRSGAPIDMDDTDALEMLAAEARRAAAVMLNLRAAVGLTSESSGCS